MIQKEMFLAENIFTDVESVPSRDGYGKGLVALGEKNKDVVVLCADLTDSTRSVWFKQKFPARFIEVGVAEQNMAAIASGLANYGKIPFISSYAIFSPGRNWEQIRTTICYNDVPVKIAGAHAGVSVGPDGATHQAIEDMGIMRIVPNMIVLCPADWVEAKKATITAAAVKKPVYLRFGREKVPVITTEQTPFTIGKAEVYRSGKDVSIIACGVMVYEALLAAEELVKEGIDAGVINSHTIKPLDKETILSAARETGALVTAEEHQVACGLGGAVAELVSEEYPVPLKRVGVKDTFGESGSSEELMISRGLTKKEIMQAVRVVIAMKQNRTAYSATTCPTHAVFHAANGMLFHSVLQFVNSLKKMDDTTFAYHVTTEKNDFAQWIRDVFHDDALAKKIRIARTREETIQILAL